MKHRITVLLLIMSMLVLTLASCGASSDDPENKYDMYVDFTKGESEFFECSEIGRASWRERVWTWV